RVARAISTARDPARASRGFTRAGAEPRRMAAAASVSPQSSGSVGATIVPEPVRAWAYPSPRSCSYASIATLRETPSWAARARVDGSRTPGLKRRARISARSARYTWRWSVPSPSSETNISEWPHQIHRKWIVARATLLLHRGACDKADAAVVSRPVDDA